MDRLNLRRFYFFAGEGKFQNEVIACIGRKYDKSNAQAMLRWNIQRGVIVSQNPPIRNGWRRISTYSTLLCLPKTRNESVLSIKRPRVSSLVATPRWSNGLSKWSRNGKPSTEAKKKRRVGIFIGGRRNRTRRGPLGPRGPRCRNRTSIFGYSGWKALFGG